MNRKIMALIIFIVAVVAIYGVIYAAVTTVLMPQDLNEFKTELDAMSQNQISNSDITQLESAAATMDSSPLSYMSKSQRVNIANEMRNGDTVPPGVLNQDFTQYNNFNYYKSLAYALVLKGDLSSGINNLSGNYGEISQQVRLDGILQVRLKDHPAPAEPVFVVHHAVNVLAQRAGQGDVVLPVVEDRFRQRCREDRARRW